MEMGQIFRYSKTTDPQKEKLDDYPNFLFHTRSPEIDTKVLSEFGISMIAEVKSKGIVRVPAILTLSSPHKVGSEETPWEDVFNLDKGRIRYFGDNKDSQNPGTRRGNKALLKQFEIHNSIDLEERKTAAPIIFFKKVSVAGKQKGYRQFSGFGVITAAERIVQHNNDTNRSFVNYCFDFAVLDMAAENDQFNWEWINLRRNENISLEETLERAPNTWKKWIKHGNQNLNGIRRNVSKVQVVKKAEQQLEKGSKESSILNKVYHRYKEREVVFEMLASKVAEHLISKSVTDYKSGWLTKGSGDSGIDFIGRMDVGSGFGAAKIIVLGQAKCEKLNSPTSGNHIARLVAKLKRGWLGVYVTTSHFSERVQIEILEDKYPLLLINGNQLAREINEILFKTGKDINEYLEEIDAEYENTIKSRDPEEILFD